MNVVDVIVVVAQNGWCCVPTKVTVTVAEGVMYSDTTRTGPNICAGQLFATKFNVSPCLLGGVPFNILLLSVDIMCYHLLFQQKDKLLYCRGVYHKPNSSNTSHDFMVLGYDPEEKTL